MEIRKDYTSAQKIHVLLCTLGFFSLLKSLYLPNSDQALLRKLSHSAKAKSHCVSLKKAHLGAFFCGRLRILIYSLIFLLVSYYYAHKKEICKSSYNGKLFVYFSSVQIYVGAIRALFGLFFCAIIILLKQIIMRLLFTRYLPHTALKIFYLWDGQS